MKTIFNLFIIFLLHQILFGACPQMENAKGYYVNNIKFDTYTKARGYIKELKKKEDGFKELEVLKLVDLNLLQNGYILMSMDFFVFVQNVVDIEPNRCYSLHMIRQNHKIQDIQLIIPKKYSSIVTCIKGCWSVKQGGLVKPHSTDEPILLYDTELKVNRKGREKVLREKRKNVHAGIEDILNHYLKCGRHGLTGM